MAKRLLRTPLPYSQAKEYCVECLMHGHMLARALLKVIVFEGGEFFAVTSEAVDVGKLHDFHSGWIEPPDTLQETTVLGVEYAARKQIHAYEEYAQYLHDFLKKDKKLWCVFEDVTLKKGDAYLSRIEADIAYLGDEVYYYLIGENCTSKKLLYLIREANAQWYYMNIVTEEPIQLKDQVLTLESVQKLAAKTVLLAIGAYDMEGFVCWEKKKQKDTD